MWGKTDDDSVRRAVALKAAIDPWVTSARDTIVAQAVSIRETNLEAYDKDTNFTYEELTQVVDCVIGDMLDVVGDAVYSEPIVQFVLVGHFQTLRELYYDQVNT